MVANTSCEIKGVASETDKCSKAVGARCPAIWRIVWYAYVFKDADSAKKYFVTYYGAASAAQPIHIAGADEASGYNTNVLLRKGSVVVATLTYEAPGCCARDNVTPSTPVPGEGEQVQTLMTAIAKRLG
jgi:hypothetical protein